MEVKVLRRRSALKMSQSVRNEVLELHELEAGQIRQVVRGSLTVYTFARKEGRILELFFHIFHEKSVPVTLLYCA